ncbi:RyR domain-containing protein [Streptomyces atratus]|uniref:RyR domain-containing protein n=1 Tax=Streptomyces atratus TaxID=1893 RepID=UPI002F909829
MADSPTPEEIARVCHEANRAWQLVTGDPSPSPEWPDAPDWQRASAVAGVRHAQSGASAEQLHAAWCEDKDSDGWRYGPAKDEVARTHPCLVPYSDPPDEQRRKDHLFAAIVAALTEGA